MTNAPIDQGVIGRDDEIRSLRRFLSDLHEGPVRLVLEGEPGIGKSTLFEMTVAAAGECGYCVLACRAVGSEVTLSFAALGDLLEPVLEEALPSLPPPQRRALEVALLLEEPGGLVPSQRETGMAVLGLLRFLAGSRPVLLAVDDVQWMDRPSVATLEFALRRVRAEPVGLLAAVRVTRDVDRAVELGHSFVHDQRIGLAPFSPAAIHRLVQGRLGISLPRPMLLRVHDASGGNPFYALELAGMPEFRGPLSDAQLAVPESLESLVRERLAALPKKTLEVLLVLASLSEPDLDVLDAATAPTGTRPDLEAAVEAGVLVRREGRIAFAHPLLRSGVYSGADAERRRRVHLRLAGVLRDPEARARHLALGTHGPDPTVARELDRAARQASGRGAPTAAAELLELAIAATPAPQRAARQRRRIKAADAYLRAGAVERAVGIWQQLQEELPPGDERALVLVRLAQNSVDLEARVALARRVLSETTDSALLSETHRVIGSGWPLAGMPHALRHGRKSLACADESGERRIVLRSLGRLGLWLLWSGRNPSGPIERGVKLERARDGLAGHESPRFVLALWRMYQGRLDEAQARFERLFDDALGQGDERATLEVRYRLADVALRAGRWPEAAVHAEAGFELAEQIGLERSGALAAYSRAFVDAHLGRIDDARSFAELGARLASSANEENTRVMNLGVLGLVELSLGNSSEALPHFTPLLHWLDSRKLGLATHPLVPYAVEALVGAGAAGPAQRLVARFDREGRALESAWCRAIAIRSRGLIAGEAAELELAVGCLEDAMVRSDLGDWPFELARGQLALGRVLRRSRQKTAAKAALEQAMATFDELGAVLWSRQSRGESDRLGLRRAPDRLTESERRVAELAAGGLTNREVAQRLFVSPKTVEANLGRVYRKLGVHSRAQLALEMLGRGSQQT